MRKKTLLIVIVVVALMTATFFSFFGRNTAKVYTVLDYKPAICTEVVNGAECGDAVVKVKDGDGVIRQFTYDGKNPPSELGVSGDTFIYANGNKLEITTNGVSDKLVSVKLVQ